MYEKLIDYFLSMRGILLYLFYLRKTGNNSNEKIKKYQYNKLKKLLIICENDVPYYKKLFKEIDFNVERDFRTIDDLKKIPITTKKNVQLHADEFLNPYYRKKSLIFKTSGSMGEPLTVYVSRNEWVMEQAIVWRHWKWNNYHFRDKMAIVRSYTPKNGKLIKMDRVRNFIYYSPYDLTDANLDIYLNHMLSNHVKFLRGYPSSVKALAEYVIRTNHKIPKLKGIFVASEILFDKDRALIENAFKVKVTNWYGLAEGIVTMGDCARHEGLHVFDEYGFVELLDTDSPTIKKIIGTNLNNYAMPLLRYETNDMAEYDGHRCSCRRHSLVVNNIIGRSNSVIKLKDRDIPLTNFYTLMEHYPKVVSWQIVQHSQNEIELILQKRVEQKIMNELYEEFRERLPKEVEFYISPEKDFITKGEGKKLAFVSVMS